MKQKHLRWLGLLGLLGLLGFATGNYGFFGFFGFFAFLGAAERGDERLSMNAYKAGFNSFVVALIAMSTLITAFSMDVGMALFTLLIAAGFILMLLTFVLSLFILERRGD